MTTGRDLKCLIEKNNLYPLIPNTHFNKLPFAKWSDENYQIKNAEEFIPLGDKFKWLNGKGENKEGDVTGYVLATGRKSNVIVVDLDVGHVEDENGISEFKDLLDRIGISNEERKIVRETLRVKTPSGGNHLYFKYKDGLVNKAKYFKGIDIRTDGGIIVMPFTKIKKDKQILEYEIVSKDIEIHEMPDCLYNAFMEKTKEEKRKEEKQKETKNKRITKNKYFKEVTEGSRNQALTQFLGMQLNNPAMRKMEYLLPIAQMYNEMYINPKLTDEELERTADSVLKYERYPYTNSKGDIIPNLLSDYLIAEHKTITLAHDIFRYNDKGFYELIDENLLQKEIFDLIPKAENKTTMKVNEVIKQMKVFTKDTEGQFDKNRVKYINCKNGLYDIENKELKQHSSDIVTNVQIQACYKQDWKEEFENSRFYKEYLPSIVQFDTFRTIQQLIGTVISPRNKELQGMWALIGDGKNGKSAFCDLLIKLLGKEFVTSIGLQELEEDKFITATLIGAVANINPDDSADELKSTAIFKKVTAGDQIMVQKKGVDSEKFTPNVTLVHGFNRMPHSKDKSDGYARRWFPIPFKNSFGSKEEVNAGERDKLKNPMLLKHIMEHEMDLVFMWAIEGLHDFMQTEEVYLSEECKETLKEYRLLIDNVRDFIEQNYTITGSSKDYIPYKVLREKYSNWCLDENIKAHKPKNYKQQLLQIRGIFENGNVNGNVVIRGLAEKKKTPF